MSNTHEASDAGADQAVPQLVGQLVGTWVVGSAVTGTLAVIFTSSPIGSLPFHSFATLAWRTRLASWVRGGVRSRLLWSAVVGRGPRRVGVRRHGDVRAGPAVLNVAAVLVAVVLVVIGYEVTDDGGPGDLIELCLEYLLYVFGSPFIAL